MTKKLVTSADNAVDSLDRLASELEKGAMEDPLALKGILAWGWHALALLTYMRIQPRRDKIDAWLWDYLDEGTADFEIERDAHWEERQRLSLLEILDISSAVELPLLKPEFYQGWTDRTVRCQTLRRQVGEIVGGSIDAEQRNGLLKLLAAYHRLLRFPAAVEVDTEEIEIGLPHLFAWLQKVLDPSGPRGAELAEHLERCKAAAECG